MVNIEITGKNTMGKTLVTIVKMDNKDCLQYTGKKWFEQKRQCVGACVTRKLIAQHD